ncbi:MAG: helix-hairpin-helix domain-containing protein [Bacteroidales bacterium]|nr:helix-hairpin-helix domain-containing protein [Bacteroidales bacterium]
MKSRNPRDSGAPGSVFKVGAIAFAFLIIGYQSALFINRAASLRIQSLRDRPDTVYVIDEALATRLLAASGEADAGDGSGDRNHPWFRKREGPAASAVGGMSEAKSSGAIFSGAEHEADGVVMVRKNAEHSPAVERERQRTRRVESFRFNPNTVSVADLIRLGFSEKQAQSIDNYRAAGGRFRRPSDFARSYVVADSVFERLEPYIVIPRTDINRADSAAFDALPGIGPYFASKMVSYRERLGGYSYKEQLMDIYRFDAEKFNAISDLVSCSPPPHPFRLWSLPADSLRLHPYIRDRQAARSIVLFRENTPRDSWSVDALESAGILPPEDAGRLKRCVIEPPVL